MTRWSRCTGWLGAVSVGVLLLGAPVPAQILPSYVVMPEVVMHGGAAVLRQGDPAPGIGGTFSRFDAIRVSPAGHVAFEAFVSGGSATQGLFLYSGGVTSLVVHNSQAAPGSASSYASFDLLAVSDTGAVVYRALHTPGSAVSQGLYHASGGTQTPLALFGQAAPGTPGLTFGAGPGTWAAARGAGSVAFIASLSGGQLGLFHAVSGASTAIVLRGDATPAGGTYDAFDERVFIDPSGRVLFWASTIGGPASGIFEHDAGLETSRILVGDATPIRGTYATLGGGISANDAGELAFHATVSDGGAPSGIFYSAGGTQTLIAQPGQSAPGTGGGSFDTLGMLSSNASGQVVFDASVSGGDTDRGIFLASGSDIEAVATRGGPVPGLAAFVFHSLVVRSDPPRPTLDGSGAGAFRAVLRSIGDEDGDGIGGLEDNCLAIANVEQCDTDQDGYGNICDGDFDQNGVTTSGDFSARFLPSFMSGIDIGYGTDMDCNGRISGKDFGDWFVPQFKAPFPGPSGRSGSGVPGLSGTAGNDATLGYLLAMQEFQGLAQSQLETRLWFDPYFGDDTTGTGTYDLPYRSFEKMKLICGDYTHCTVKGKGRVFSPLTLVLTAADFAVGEDFYVGETVSWNAGADTGSVLDYDRASRILVLDRDTGTLDPDASDDIAGVNPTRSVGVDSVTNTINLSAGTSVDDVIDTSCEDRDALCTLFDSEYPEFPARIDGNRFGLLGSTATDGCGVFCAGGDGSGGWIGVQNIIVQNMASDNFSNQSADTGKLVALNVRAVDVRNGSEARTVEAVPGDRSTERNNCFTTHGSGAVIVINAGDCESRVDSSSGSGACVAPTGTNKLTMIGTGRLSSVPVASKMSPTFGTTGGDVTIVGHYIVNPSTNTTSVVTGSANPGTPIGFRFARVVIETLRASSSTNRIMLSSNRDDVELSIYESSIVGRGRFLTMVGDATHTMNVVGRALLIDDSDYWVLTGSTSNISLDIQNSIYDDEDAVTGTAEWSNNTTEYATLALAQAGFPATWKLFTNSFDSGAGADGTQWGTDSVQHRCQSTSECWEAGGSDYTIDLTTASYGSDPDDSCVPIGVLPGGARLCSLTLSPTHIGAR